MEGLRNLRQKSTILQWAKAIENQNAGKFLRALTENQGHEN
jgi:hypothetical protein